MMSIGLLPPNLLGVTVFRYGNPHQQTMVAMVVGIFQDVSLTPIH